MQSFTAEPVYAETTHTHKDAGKLKEAILLLTAGAEAGCDFAFYDLAHCYLNGLGVKEDKNEALRLYKIGAEKGCSCSKHKIGLIYDGINRQQAIKLYKAAQEQGCDVRGRIVELESCCGIM